MKITPINNTQISHKGYLDKSVYNYINTAAENEKKDLYRIVTKAPEKQFKAAITKIENLRTNVTEMLENFATMCHEKTYFSIKNDINGNRYLCINNKILKLKNDIDAAVLPLLGNKDASSEIVVPLRTHKNNALSDLGEFDLKQLELYCNELNKISAKAVDDKVLLTFESELEKGEHSAWGILSRITNGKKFKHYLDLLS